MLTYYAAPADLIIGSYSYPISSTSYWFGYESLLVNYSRRVEIVNIQFPSKSSFSVI